MTVDISIDNFMSLALNKLHTGVTVGLLFDLCVQLQPVNSNIGLNPECTFCSYEDSIMVISIHTFEYFLLNFITFFMDSYIVINTLILSCIYCRRLWFTACC